MSNDALIGKQLGDYTIKSLLGQGGMARVYKGYDSRLDRYAAVKVIEPNQLASEDDEEYRQRFLREARAIARLNHPRVVGVFQFGETQHLYYMAMVFVEGRDLRQILKEYNRQKKYLPHSQVLRIIRDTAEALDYSHSQGVIHRDVKPSNIMVMADGHVVLTDFGLALSAQDRTLGNTFGSVHYIAPEQAVSSAQAVPQSDLYSLGVVLYEMLTGRVPFEDVSAMSIALKHISDPPPLPSTINPTITPQVEEVLQKALDKDPTRRFPNGRAFVHALEGAFAVSDEEDTHDMDANTAPLPLTDAKMQESAENVLAYGEFPKSDDFPLEEAVIFDVKTDPSFSSRRSRPAFIEATPFGMSTVPMNTEASNGKARRRSPLRPLIVLLLVLLIGTGIAFAAGVFDNDSDGNSPTEVAGGAEQIPSITPGASQTEEPAIQLSATHPTRRTESSATATFTAIATPTPSATATEAPTEITESAPTSAAENVPTISANEPTAALPLDAQSDEEPEILLWYNQNELIIYNRAFSSSVQIDVRRLRFNNPTTQSNFTSADWQYDGARWRMRPQADCFQIIDIRFIDYPKPDFCLFRQAFERQFEPFWNGEGTFEVYVDDALAVTCPTIGNEEDVERRCTVDIP